MSATQERIAEMKTALKGVGKSMADLSSAAGVQQSTVWRWSQGKHSPSVDVFTQVETAFSNLMESCAPPSANVKKAEAAPTAPSQ